MTVRRFFAAVALLVAPAAVAAPAADPQPGTETSTAGTLPSRTNQTQRKIERSRPGTPLKPRMIEAPGAAVMMIPASFDPVIGPFSPL